MSNQQVKLWRIHSESPSSPHQIFPLYNIIIIKIQSVMYWFDSSTQSSIANRSKKTILRKTCRKRFGVILHQLALMFNVLLIVSLVFIQYSPQPFQRQKCLVSLTGNRRLTTDHNYKNQENYMMRGSLKLSSYCIKRQ